MKTAMPSRTPTSVAMDYGHCRMKTSTSRTTSLFSATSGRWYPRNTDQSDCHRWNRTGAQLDRRQLLTRFSYDVYSSTSANGTYSLLTTTPITTTTYTDLSKPIGVVYYHVTAVDTTQNPVAASAPCNGDHQRRSRQRWRYWRWWNRQRWNHQPGTCHPALLRFDYAGQPVTFNPLTGAIDTTGTINPATVQVTTPNHGGTATVAFQRVDHLHPGREFHRYRNLHLHGLRQQFADLSPQTITFTDSQPVIAAPIVNNYFTTTLAGVAVSIPVLSVDDAVTTFNTSSVKITTQSTHGTVVVNADGSVTYTPNATFIGGDTFTYTVADNNGQTSSGAIVDINVGAEISTLTKGANHTLVYPALSASLSL